MGSHNKDFITEHIARTIINLAEYRDFGFDHDGRYEFTQLMNSVSGLLILPVEFIIKASKDNQPMPLSKVLDSKISDLYLSFAININNKLKYKYDNLVLRKFLKLIRNSFSHFNLEPINHNDKFIGLTIWNTDDNGNKTFEMSFKRKEFLGFIVFISELFLNDQRFDKKSYPDFMRALYKLKIEATDNQIMILKECIWTKNEEYINATRRYLKTNLMIKNSDIEGLLLQELFDKNNPTYLRLAFFEIFLNNFKDSSINFYQNDLENFLSDDLTNIPVTSEIINSSYWILDSSDLELKNKVGLVVKNYCKQNQKVLKELDSSTKEFYGIKG